MIRYREDMTVEKKENLMGGEGTIIMRELVKKEELMGNGRMFNLVTIEPGCSLGLHTHEHETEYYYIIKGNVLVNDNGEEKKLSAGDVMVIGNGQSHSAKNNGTYTVEMIAVILFGDLPE